MTESTNGPPPAQSAEQPIDIAPSFWREALNTVLAAAAAAIVPELIEAFQRVDWSVVWHAAAGLNWSEVTGGGIIGAILYRLRPGALRR